jgi:AcrR family transcriptional regulator
LSNMIDQPDTQLQLQRPKRADARRNYDALVAAARATFTEDGTSAPLEDIAERAGLGITTLYRHFPTRQELLEAVYVDEVEALARSANELTELPPWEALSQWLHQYVGFAATKHALAEALLEEAPDSDVLGPSRTAILSAGTGLLERAQQAGVVRPDADVVDVVRLVGGISLVPATGGEQKQRMLELALDGLRYQPQG